MPKVFSEAERDMVRTLSSEGLNNIEIATRMAEAFPDNWSAKSAHRSVARILKERPEESRVPQPQEDGPKTLDEMTRDERFKYIEARLQVTPRFRMAFRNFDKEEKEVFVDEYLNIIKSTDTLTEAEEQALFAAILELILAFQALSRKEAEERLRDQSMAGEIDPDDPKFRKFVDDKYQKEYDSHMKLYQKGMESLKMSRQQRLKVISSQKQSLVDLAQDLTSRSAQSEVAEEIERLSRVKDAELKTMLDNGHLHGIFEEYQ